MKKVFGIVLVMLSLWSLGVASLAAAQTTQPSPSGTGLNPAEIARQLDAAKAAHQQAIDDAKKSLLHTIDQRVDAATNAGDLNLVTSLQAAQATAAVDATVPDDVKDPAVLAAKSTYEYSVKSANTRLNLAYQRAVRDYTRAHEIAQAQSTQAEMNSLGLVDPAAPSAMTVGTYQLATHLPSFLTAKDSVFLPLGDRLGIVVPETQFVLTRVGDLLTKNFTADFWFYMVQGMQGYSKLPPALIGLGEGTVNPVNGGPLNALYLEINPPDQNNGEVNLHRRTTSEKINIGHLKEFDTYVARIQKSGNSVTFTVGTEQNGSLVPVASVTVDDVRNDSPYLADDNTHLFFGSGAFEKISIGKGPPPAKAETDAKPLVDTAAPKPTILEVSPPPQDAGTPTKHESHEPVTNSPQPPAQVGPGVVVEYQGGVGEFATLKDGVKYFKDQKFPVVDLQNELVGLTFTRRGITDTQGFTLNCPTGSTVYVLADFGADPQMDHTAHLKFDHLMTDSGWVRLKDTGIHADRTPAQKYHHLMVYKMTCSKADNLVVPSLEDHQQGTIRSGNITVASSVLTLGTDSGK